LKYSTNLNLSFSFKGFGFQGQLKVFCGVEHLLETNCFLSRGDCLRYFDCLNFYFEKLYILNLFNRLIQILNFISKFIASYLKVIACLNLNFSFLLQHLVDHITSDELKPKEILQSSFDLLGELMKFNPFAFKRFDQVISDKQVSKHNLVVFGVNFVVMLVWRS